ncbi:hypothetical protein NF867_12980 [Solitalea sp. MAHUQ-68]|uniref:Cytochrome c domain-containing protein n=1 Tax=Solitalea agri TaxID=2953739 RepID=A0A9X2F3Y5_9SPHI|nr:hypothetical protein [Solitalea agri]MCO4293779.1 hypothetical protein [Solitalea agri]
MIDTTRLLSGHREGSTLPPLSLDVTKPGNWVVFGPELTAAAGPWGMSFSANLTPDETTGIGSWTEDVFIKTLRTGKHLGMDTGRSILPPMPWYEDLKAVFAYLHSLPPVKNQVPGPVPPDQVMKMLSTQ